VCDFIVSAYRLEVEDADFYGSGSLKNPCQGYFILKMSERVSKPNRHNRWA